VCGLFRLLRVVAACNLPSRYPHNTAWAHRTAGAGAWLACTFLHCLGTVLEGNRALTVVSNQRVVGCCGGVV